MHKEIGNVLVVVPDLKAALSDHDQALHIDRRLDAKHPSNAQALLDLSFSQGKAGLVLAELGQIREGLPLLRAGTAAQESLLQNDPENNLSRGYLETRVAQVGFR